MLIFKSAKELQDWALEQRTKGVKVGLVPTMGYLHEGHLSLIAEARKRADAVVVSVFVNPVQFGPNEDYEKYPRDEEHDLAACEKAGAAAVYLPTPETMYAPDASTYVEEKDLCTGLCGARRPGHFRGVCTVVAKLFNLALPQVAVFGQKDFQQAAVIKRMVRDLNFPLEIVVAPIVREPDGLAKSSRNVYLSAEERQNALGLSRTLALAADEVANGPCKVETLRPKMVALLEKHALRVDYVELMNPETLQPVETVSHGTVALLAVFCGKTRLIDNRIL